MGCGWPHTSGGVGLSQSESWGAPSTLGLSLVASSDPNFHQHIVNGRARRHSHADGRKPHEHKPSDAGHRTREAQGKELVRATAALGLCLRCRPDKYAEDELPHCAGRGLSFRCVCDCGVEARRRALKREAQRVKRKPVNGHDVEHVLLYRVKFEACVRGVWRKRERIFNNYDEAVAFLREVGAAARLHNARNVEFHYGACTWGTAPVPDDVR